MILVIIIFFFFQLIYSVDIDNGVDIVFIVDASQRTEETLFRHELMLIPRVMDHLKVEEDQSRFALITYSNYASLQIGFGFVTNKNALLNKLWQIHQNRHEKSSLCYALKLARNHVFIHNSCCRQKMVVIFSNSKWNLPVTTRKEAKLLRKMGVRILLFVIGDDIDKYSTRQLTSPTNIVYHPHNKYNNINYNFIFNFIIKNINQGTSESIKTEKHIKNLTDTTTSSSIINQHATNPIKSTSLYATNLNTTSYISTNQNTISRSINLLKTTVSSTNKHTNHVKSIPTHSTNNKLHTTSKIKITEKHLNSHATRTSIINIQTNKAKSTYSHTSRYNSTRVYATNRNNKSTTSNIHGIISSHVTTSMYLANRNTTKTTHTHSISTHTLVQSCSNLIGKLVFVLDSTDSIGKNNFQLQLETTKNIINGIFQDKSKLSIALLTHGIGAIINLSFDNFRLIEDINTTISNISYSGGQTGLGTALSLINIKLFANTNSKKIVVIFFPAMEDNGPDPVIISDVMKSSFGVHIFVLAIGPNISRWSASQMASGNDSNIFIPDFKSLINFQEIIIHSLCKL